MKKALAIIGSVVLVITLTYPVFSQDSGHVGDHHMSGDYGGSGRNFQDGGMNSNLSPEQRAHMDRLHREFVDETSSIRTQMLEKSRELNRILNLPEPNFKEARALQRELSDLRATLDQKHLNYQIASRKIAPSLNQNRDYGSHHMDDNHSGMGYGHHMGGYNGQHMGSYGSGGCN